MKTYSQLKFELQCLIKINAHIDMIYAKTIECAGCRIKEEIDNCVLKGIPY